MWNVQISAVMQHSKASSLDRHTGGGYSWWRSALYSAVSSISQVQTIEIHDVGCAGRINVLPPAQSVV